MAAVCPPPLGVFQVLLVAWLSALALAAGAADDVSASASEVATFASNGTGTRLEKDEHIVIVDGIAVALAATFTEGGGHEHFVNLRPLHDDSTVVRVLGVRDPEAHEPVTALGLVSWRLRRESDAMVAAETAGDANLNGCVQFHWMTVTPGHGVVSHVLHCGAKL